MSLDSALRAPLDPALRVPCPAPCGSHGTCNELTGRCMCQLGWVGARCDVEEHPACALRAPGSAPRPLPLLRVPCGSLRKISPVACECVSQCLASGEEVCAFASAGCGDKWRQPLPRRHRWRQSLTLNVTTKDGFYANLSCVATPAGATAHSGVPAPAGSRLMSYADYRRTGFVESAPPVAVDALPAYGAGMWRQVPQDLRIGGREHTPPLGSVFVPEARCGSRGCHGRGRCVAPPRERPRCECVDGAFGERCEHVCVNDCMHACSGHGTCLHGWCSCEPGWFGVDCSDTFLPREPPRSTMAADPMQFGPGPVGLHKSKLESLPGSLSAHVRRLRRAVYIYELPASVNRVCENWMARYWPRTRGDRGSFAQCDPVHMRRIYQAQTHFDSHLLHDDYVRTLDPREAKLFYVPAFLSQRITWGGEVRAPLLAAYEHVRTAYPYWNASAGRDHVWFLFGEKMTCDVPSEILDASIVVGHWGGSKTFVTPRGEKRFHTDCVDPKKDVVVPPITPIQHDLAKFKEKLQPALHKADKRGFDRNGPLLLFAGGIFSFGASQDNMRATGKDPQEKLDKWQARADTTRCAKPTATCRGIYSMGVRQAVWRQRLWAEKDMRIVSAGIPDYLTAVPSARFCLHTEGNSWGTRLMDYMAMECIPLIVNDGMVFP